MDEFSNTLSALSLGFGMFIVPALICGSVLALPSLLFVRVQKLSERHFPRFGMFVIGLMGICSFVVAWLVITWSLIDMVSALDVPNSHWAELQHYHSEVTEEATYRSVVPIYFQKPCVRHPEIICQLGNKYTIDAYEMPLLSGLTSAATTILIGVSAQKKLIRFHPSQRGVAV